MSAQTPSATALPRQSTSVGCRSCADSAVERVMEVFEEEGFELATLKRPRSARWRHSRSVRHDDAP